MVISWRKYTKGIDPDRFCQRHGSQNQINKPKDPPDLLSVAEVLMPRLFLRLVQHLRDNCESATLDRYHSVILMADDFLTLLHAHSEMGADMRAVMTQALINPQLYYQLAVCYENSNGPSQSYKQQSLTKYLDARNSFECPSDTDGIDSDNRKMLPPSIAYSMNSLKHSSFLDELVFWIIKFEFPQKLVCLLLNMMPDLNYKEAFTKIFVQRCEKISKMLAKPTDFDTLSKDQKNTLQCEDKLSHDFKELFIQGQNCDIKLNVKGTEFQAHKVILEARSSVFRAMFQQDMAEKNDGIVTITDCDPDCFQVYLLYIYTGKVEKISRESVQDLYFVADKYDADEVMSACVKFMLKDLCVENFCDYITVALQHDESVLLEYAKDFFMRNIKDIIKTVKWQSFIEENPAMCNELFIHGLDKVTLIYDKTKI